MIRPTTDQIDTGAVLTLPDGRKAKACRYPSMGGYAGACWAIQDGDCFELHVWHDGDFAFNENGGSPRILHHCSARQFIEFGTMLDEFATPTICAKSTRAAPNEETPRCREPGCNKFAQWFVLDDCYEDLFDFRCSEHSENYERRVSVCDLPEHIKLVAREYEHRLNKKHAEIESAVKALQAQEERTKLAIEGLEMAQIHIEELEKKAAQKDPK